MKSWNRRFLPIVLLLISFLSLSISFINVLKQQNMKNEFQKIIANRKLEENIIPVHCEDNCTDLTVNYTDLIERLRKLEQENLELKTNISFLQNDFNVIEKINQLEKKKSDKTDIKYLCKQEELNNFYTKSEIDADFEKKLNNYYTKIEINENHLNKTELDKTLKSYLKSTEKDQIKNEFNQILENYPNRIELNKIIDSKCIVNDSCSGINNKLKNYYTKGEINNKFNDTLKNYYTKGELNNKFNNYYTSTSINYKFNDSLKNYYTKVELNNRFNNYYTKNQIDNKLKLK